MSSKNSLQEFCTRKKYQPPSYDTKRVGGDPHDPKWFSTVTVILPSGTVTVPGDICSAKVEAEKSAASYMLKGLEKDELEKEESPVQELPVQITENEVKSSSMMVILIDVENIPGMVFPSVNLKQKYPDKIKIYACVGKYHHSADKNFGRHVTKIVVPTTRKDGVDTFIQMYAGLLSQTSSFEFYAFATRDHFGHALAELIQSSFRIAETPVTTWKKKKAATVTTQEQLFDFFTANMQ